MDGRRKSAYQYGRSEEGRSLLKYAHETYTEEPGLHLQAINILPTFDSQYNHFLMAGQNDCVVLEVDKYGVDKKTGKKYVRLWLP